MAVLFHSAAAAMIAGHMDDEAVRAPAFAETVCEMRRSAIWRRTA